MTIAVLQKDKRRTGAGMLVHSGAVRDDPQVFIEVQARRMALDLAKRDADRAGNMAHFKRRGTAHIHNESRTTVARGPGFLHRCSQNFRLAERKFGGRRSERWHGGLSRLCLLQRRATGGGKKNEDREKNRIFSWHG